MCVLCEQQHGNNFIWNLWAIPMYVSHVSSPTSLSQVFCMGGDGRTDGRTDDDSAPLQYNRCFCNYGDTVARHIKQSPKTSHIIFKERTHQHFSQGFMFGSQEKHNSIPFSILSNRAEVHSLGPPAYCSPAGLSLGVMQWLHPKLKGSSLLHRVQGQEDITHASLLRCLRQPDSCQRVIGRQKCRCADLKKKADLCMAVWYSHHYIRNNNIAVPGIHW